MNTYLLKVLVVIKNLYRPCVKLSLEDQEERSELSHGQRESYKYHFPLKLLPVTMYRILLFTTHVNY